MYSGNECVLFFSDFGEKAALSLHAAVIEP